MDKKVCRALFMVFVFTLFIASAQTVVAEQVSDKKITHGTATEWITEDMINNAPPEDYIVNAFTQGEAKDGAYNAYFLENDIQIVHIEIDENNLNYLLQNAIDGPYVMATSVTIGDTTLGYCGLKTKGSVTLERSVNEEGNDRFSFTINFGKYIKKKDYGQKQNFYGCDKISFNNFFYDNSMMKEYLSLKLMDEMGVPTPQYGFTKLYINGEYYGVYLMVETMDSSVLEQHYQLNSEDVSNYLCKPEYTNLLYDEISKDASPLWENDEDTYKDVEDMLPTVTEWVRKLNCLSEGTDFDGKSIDVNSKEYLELLGQVMDVDEAVRYFAVHSWLCQIDNMFVSRRNFGLYISATGVSTIIPWDYDLSFGCYYPGDAEQIANYALDVMYINVDGQANEDEISKSYYEKYPLFNVIYQNEDLMKQYHSYMKECSKIATLGGKVEASGKIYEPGFFNTLIDDMQEKLADAALESMPTNVRYTDGVEQPEALSKALPNLAKLIIARSVGVYVQVQDIEARVSVSECNVASLGGLKGTTSIGSNTGKLAIADANTGVFVVAEYKDEQAASPMLTVDCLEKSDSIYEEIKKAANYVSDEQMLVYAMKNTGSQTSSYTLTVPLSREFLNEGMEPCFYSYEDGKLKKINMTADDNLFTGTTKNIGYIVVLLQPEGSTGGADSNIMPIVVIIGAIVLATAAVSIFVIKRRKLKIKIN